MQSIKRVRWDIAGPVGLIVLALATVAWLDVSKGGEATPKPPMGTIGTPIRGAYIAPTATPIGFAPTPRPKPTVSGAVARTASVRDGKRRSDLLLLLAAAARAKARDGAYPGTNGNVQTLCNYKEIDSGCKILSLADASATLADPLKIGYWYSSDGKTARFYASLEEDVPAGAKCSTNDAELQKHDNVICVNAE